MKRLKEYKNTKYTTVSCIDIHKKQHKTSKRLKFKKNALKNAKLNKKFGKTKTFKSILRFKGIYEKNIH